MYRLMIVEDETLIRAGLMKYFNWEELGFSEITEAENGLDALIMAKETKPDFILTDIRMPKMDGLQLIEELRSHLPDCIFVILSGYEDFSYARKAITLGVTSYLIKPLQYEESLETIRQAVCKMVQIKQDRQKRAFAEQVLLEKEIQVKEKYLAESAAGEDPIFSRIESYILKNIDKDISLNMIATAFYYNPAYLSRLFKSKLNKNYITFLTEVRIKFAKERLRNPSFSVSEVGSICGYQSYKHFVKNFKKVTGITPSDYRKRIGETV